MWSNSRHMQKLTRLSLLGLLFLTACGGLTTSDKLVTRTWLLMPLEQSVNTVTSETATTIDLSVVAVPGLDTDRILTLSKDAELNNFAGARWAGHTPEMLESLLSRALQGSGNFKVISSQADCDLQLEVQEFFAYTGSSGTASEVQIEINGQYSCRSEKSKPIHLRASIPVFENKMSTIVSAFQTAINQVLADLLPLL